MEKIMVIDLELIKPWQTILRKLLNHFYSTKLKNDFVLDIASNDGTLLNSYSKNVIKIGIDPIIYKFKKFYKNIEYPINNFFSFKVLKKRGLIKNLRLLLLYQFLWFKKTKYFLSDIFKLLIKNGIFCSNIQIYYQ